MRENSLLHYFKDCTSAAVDSRLVQPGALFFALKGFKTDGHDYLFEVGKNGAKAAVVDKNYEGDSYGLDLFFVEDPLFSLQELAKEVQSTRNTFIIAVTGSVGKTTTKEFIAHLLAAHYKVGKTPGNSNSQVGIPLTILNVLKGDEEIAVLEMGMTHSGNISKLVEIVAPDMAVITAIELVHAANFASKDKIAEAKGEILRHPKTKIILLNEKVKDYQFFPNENALETVYYSANDEIGPSTLPNHLKENLAAAVFIARHFNLPEETIRERIDQIAPVERRFFTQMKSGIQIINDAYNASEPSMIAALHNLPHVTGKKIAVLGEMLDLGKFSIECHERVGKAALEAVDEVFLIGEGCEPILRQFLEAGKKASLYHDRASLFKEVKPCLNDGDLLLLKGSRHWGLCALAEEL